MLSLSVDGQTVRFNELASRNESSVVDDYGEFEDWIEIYNESRKDINLGGWFISDDSANPSRWRIPESDPKTTLIPAGAYLLLWADRDTAQGSLHIDLKLSKTGESIYLYKKDQSGFILEDSVTYPELSKDLSYGICSVTVKAWKILKQPSPGLPNICPFDKMNVKKKKKAGIKPA